MTDGEARSLVRQPCISHLGQDIRGDGGLGVEEEGVFVRVLGVNEGGMTEGKG